MKTHLSHVTTEELIKGAPVVVHIKIEWETGIDPQKYGIIGVDYLNQQN